MCVFMWCGHIERLGVNIRCFLQLEGWPASHRVPLTSPCYHASSAPSFYVGAPDRKLVLLLVQQVHSQPHGEPFKACLAFIMIHLVFGTRAIFWHVCTQSPSSHTLISHSEFLVSVA